MPAATTHAEFAKQVFKLLPEEEQKKITSKPMYYLGSQGPDLFFFHKYMFLPGSLNQYGGMMHSDHVWETIAYMKKHTHTPALHSYFMGFLTHYALDSSCHPIINAYSKKEYDLEGRNESEAHFRIEGEIDAWLLNSTGRSIQNYNVYTMLKVSRQEAKELGRMYHGLFQEVYGLDIPEKAIENACYDCARITKQLKPGTRKHRVAHRVEKIAKMPHLITGMMLTDKENAQPAVLNPEHDLWVWYGQYRKTFPELMKEAEELALKLIPDPQKNLIKKNFNGVPEGETIL
ncbi:MAG: zinc dependent phospholipase C family protein [Solobacterium sp.]|nr:zinc dependent phospholipase C family protein [Solobacterium sp.]